MSSTEAKAAGIILTNTPATYNAPLIGLAEGINSFSNYHLAALVLGVPWLVKRILPIVNRGGFYTYWFLVLVLGVPVTIGYWTAMSRYGSRKNNKVVLPGKDLEEYITIKDADLQKEYHGKTKIPMQIFHDAYFDGKIDIKGDVLEALEARHDWSSFGFTVELFKFVFLEFIPVVIGHGRDKDQEQIQDTYDRGHDFYGWFLGPRMIYTTGVVTDLTREETLEEIQDNKLTVVCEKLGLQPGDRLLDIGCGWGTLVAFAAKNYGCDVTGVTLAKTQAEFGNDRIKNNGLTHDQARVLNVDFRDAPGGPGHYTKIVSLEMAEHVGIRRYGAFLKQVYDLLDDNGVFLFQVAGLRVHWTYDDLVWGLFMNKYIFPGADASCALSWVITQLEHAGFEVKNIDVLGVHYSATIWRWYKNWIANKDLVVKAYGEKWYRIWVFFLAYSVIIARQGGSSLFQITLHKNLNAYPRINGVPNHQSIHVKPARTIVPIE